MDDLAKYQASIDEGHAERQRQFEQAFRELPACCNADPLATKTVVDCTWLARIELDLHEEKEDGCCSKREAFFLRRYLKKWGDPTEKKVKA